MAAISPVFHTEKSILGLSGKGGWVATKQGSHLVITSVLTLRIEKSFDCDPNTHRIFVSPDSKYIACHVVKDEAFSIDILDLDSSKIIHRIENIGRGIAVCRMEWSPDSNYLLYFSEFEVFLGIFSVMGLTNRLIKGPTLDSFGNPLICFSPADNGNYCAMVRHDRIYVYNAMYRKSCWPLVQEYRSDVNTTGIMYAGSMTLVVWNSSGLLRAISPDGKSRFAERMQPGSNVKSVAVSPCLRLVAVLTQDSKVFIYDTLSWKRLLALEHRYLVKKEDCRHIVKEPNLMNDDSVEMPYAKHDFVNIANAVVRFKEVQNISDSFKMKTNRRYRAVFSPSGRYLATYDPAIPTSVWIWSIMDNSVLASLIILDESTLELQGLKWHTTEDSLAAILQGRVVFWTRGDRNVFGVFGQRRKFLKFSWCNTKSIMGAITSSDTGVLVYLPSCVAVTEDCNLG